MSMDAQIRDLERRVLLGDAVALEQLKAAWIRAHAVRLGDLELEEMHKKRCVAAAKLNDLNEAYRRSDRIVARWLKPRVDPLEEAEAEAALVEARAMMAMPHRALPHSMRMPPDVALEPGEAT